MTQTLIEKNKLERFITKQNTSHDLFDLDELISQATLGIEELARDKLLNKKAVLSFPQLNPDFLSMEGKNLHILHDSNGRFVRPNDKFTTLSSVGDGRPIKIKIGKYDLQISIPKFVIYSLNNPYFEINGNLRVKYHWRDDPKNKHHKIGKERIHMNQNIHSVFYDPLSKAITYSPKRKCDPSFDSDEFEYKWIARSKFIGIIPNKIKEVINNVKPLFGDDLYLIAEAGQWELESKVNKIFPTIASGNSAGIDPLLVGVSKDNTCYLIDEFDITPAEWYVKKEFSTK